MDRHGATAVPGAWDEESHGLRGGRRTPLRPAFGRRHRGVGPPGALSWWPLHLLRTKGFTGDVYPVNPTRDEIDGLRCYASVGDVPGDRSTWPSSRWTPTAACRPGSASASRPGSALSCCRRRGSESRAPTGWPRSSELAGYATAGGLRIVGHEHRRDRQHRQRRDRLDPAVVRRGHTGRGRSRWPRRAARRQARCSSASSARGSAAACTPVPGTRPTSASSTTCRSWCRTPRSKLVLSFVEALRRPQEFLEVAALAARPRQADRPDQGRAQRAGRAARRRTHRGAGRLRRGLRRDLSTPTA